MQKLIEAVETAAILEWASAKGLLLNYDSDRHKIILEKDGRKVASVRLALSVSYSPESGTVKPVEKNHVLCMVKAGMAAIGYFENGQNISHKVFRAYMVRKKQGKSQIKHLKTKGKSRAGSRIRLAESEKFFEQINSRLTAYLNTYHIDYIGYACSKTLWPFLFKANLKDHKQLLYKIPIHVQQPSYERLLSINKRLQMTAIQTEEKESAFFAPYFQKNPDPASDEDSW
ncbi:hypothetical protein SAMN04488057_104121 [Cyclobacterium lianum]|uniref:VLRF1 domain-containing protein n=1 Tax=Cyclobacterium lianum TaxID=388280 RepID=A0A1M7M626_9BACT|nr:hypothetical protein [Cyclobacterium lianum]SHM86167.1 hypothetical protein SAMN04488057_104121 [Cyclobacterium lianum]